eukprot:TRINITY_DN324_c1_g1_i7.p1 TRINITY_DN324_c1_g1~~TRINITY_DN324_c1_g1_i7.p1  ORF type:complete len:226 (+),score=-14.03 TRINITY_DN324_c1_g1_i7:263-940(+)
MKILDSNLEIQQTFYCSVCRQNFTSKIILHLCCFQCVQKQSQKIQKHRTFTSLKYFEYLFFTRYKAIFYAGQNSHFRDNYQENQSCRNFRTYLAEKTYLNISKQFIYLLNEYSQQLSQKLKIFLPQKKIFCKGKIKTQKITTQKIHIKKKPRFQQYQTFNNNSQSQTKNNRNEQSNSINLKNQLKINSQEKIDYKYFLNNENRNRLNTTQNKKQFIRQQIKKQAS